MTFFLFSTVVYAASVNGEFKGNPIVKVKTNGKELTVENTPAVIYNGNTLVPIYMLRQLGATVNWDQKTYSVDVTIPANESPSIDIDKIKTLVWALDYYSALNQHGKSYSVLQLILQLNFSFIQDNYNVSTSLDDSNARLNEVINEYNRLQTQADGFINTLNSVGVYDVNINNALNGYFKAIDYYKLAVDELNKFSNGNQNSLNAFFDNIKLAITEQNNGSNAASNGYSSLYRTIQNLQNSPPPTTNPTVIEETPVVVPTTPSVIKSTIVGDFEGLDNGNIYELDNGQYWKQTDYTYKYSYKYRPDVLIYKDGSSYYIRVDGIDKDAKVEQIK